ncbi:MULTISPECIES: hypothetical protein [Streptomyces]|uniref:Uncharacterized protein n=1 Tax=Streptomyces thermoviolaceus subsp. thermoviolaceus TaxID=66860 RepID=A0ABX0Z283_STRTL|nr:MULTISPECIES: hypothetical protein [Streptomyces]WTD49271.1 hypothetical protein OG899_18200 [Streptomyces thermoviolaceus]NJP17385.1 hypothetical protein [Streptomyces thermoviolaceus subsp. thermoviolaceus]RSS03506.1 hypothetical protein EF917_13335 [Streptomyces sp. WAC00469]GGV60146.1 hypothetical protein GCM10010499_00440 [Streptomyces thermoviolaceus subsp. apingens]GHA98774.1 hypothetical protein GCM10010512_32960 [Streptomyces thermoviolaceus subsp. thermoviolaceus]
MQRVRPGAASRGGTGGSPSRAAGEGRVLAGLTAGGPFARAHAAGPARQAGEEPETSEADGRPADLARLWHITLRVCGTPAPLEEVRRGLEQLAHDHPFLLTSRYADDHAEIRYWEEARDLHDAAAVALRLWGEHRRSAQLPPWEIVGLEVVDRDTYHQRLAEGYGPPPATPVGVHPF